MLYDLFFTRVVSLDIMADALDSQGRAGAALRTSIQRQAKLTTPEAATLDSIATASHAATTAITNQVRSLQANGMAPSAPQIQDLLNQRKQSIVESMNKLQAAFAPPRFALLDSFIRATTNVRAYHATPPSQ